MAVKYAYRRGGKFLDLWIIELWSHHFSYLMSKSLMSSASQDGLSWYRSYAGHLGILDKVFLQPQRLEFLLQQCGRRLWTPLCKWISKIHWLRNLCLQHQIFLKDPRISLISSFSFTLLPKNSAVRMFQTFPLIFQQKIQFSKLIPAFLELFIHIDQIINIFQILFMHF